jgi:hypothetical protein
MAKNFAIGGKLSDWFTNIGMKADCFYVLTPAEIRSARFSLAFDLSQVDS